MACLVPTVVAGIAVSGCYVRRETVVLSGLGPGRRAVEARLNDSATTTLVGPAGAILGNAIRLWHACGGGGEPPLQRTSG